VIFDTDSKTYSQTTLGALVGVLQPRISQLMTMGVIPEAVTLGEAMLAYCAYMREIAAGRSTNGPLDLAQERAALARSQREGVDLKNAILRGEYAELRVLEQLLAAAAQAVVERMDHLPGLLHAACPDLPPAAVDQLMTTLATARNEWQRSTARLVVEQVAAIEDEDEASEVDTLCPIGPTEGADDAPAA
jgi:phage terminase Nu1 subunit (DNA packaging protein)